MYYDIASVFPFLYGEDTFASSYTIYGIHMLLHSWWVVRMHYCDIALIVVLFTCILICGRFFVFCVQVFFITDIVSDFSGLFLFYFLLFILFMLYIFIYVIFILWMIYNWIIWVHSWNVRIKVMVIVGFFIWIVGVGVVIIWVSVWLFIVQWFIKFVIWFIYNISTISLSKCESNLWISAEIQGMDAINNFIDHPEFVPAI